MIPLSVSSVTFFNLLGKSITILPTGTWEGFFMTGSNPQSGVNRALTFAISLLASTVRRSLKFCFFSQSEPPR